MHDSFPTQCVPKAHPRWTSSLAARLQYSSPVSPLLVLLLLPPRFEPSLAIAGASMCTLATSHKAKPTTGVSWRVVACRSGSHLLSRLASEGVIHGVAGFPPCLPDGSLHERIKFANEARGFFGGAAIASLEDERGLVCNCTAPPPPAASVSPIA